MVSLRNEGFMYITKSISRCAVEEPSSESGAGKERCIMSLCMGIVYDKEIYFAADSRSSVIVKRSVRSQKPILVESINDDFKKIIPLTVNKTQLVIVTTGINAFGIMDTPIYELISNIDYSSCESLWDISMAIKRKVDAFTLRKVKDISIDIFCFENSCLCRAEINFLNYDRPIVIHKHIQSYDGTPFIITIGVDWCHNLQDYHPFPVIKENDDETMYIINSFYEKCIQISNIMEGSIGGPIRIGKLTPDGFTWLQNGYEI